MSDLDTENTLSIASSGIYSEESINGAHTHLERQDSLEIIDSIPDGSQPILMEPREVNGHTEKVKKDKKHFMHVFKRSKKHKDKQNVDPRLGVSIGSAETKRSFSKLKTQRMGTSISHLTPPVTRRSRSNSILEDPGSYSDGGQCSESEFIETLVNPTAAALSRSTSQLDSIENGASVSLDLSESRSETRLSNNIDSETGDMESKLYNVLVTLHSGHNLAIRDRTGSSDPYVKFKCGQFKYRSSVIHRNLNPEWNETFSFRTSNLKVPIEAHVYDHDFGSLDDYMGGQSINLEAYATSDVQIIDLGLECPVAAARGENLGSIRLFIQVTPITEGEPPQEPKKGWRSNSGKGFQVWNGVVTVVLMEGHDLPALDENGFSDPYCKLKLGRQKHKSKTIHKTLNPEWRERCILRMYDGSTTLHLEVWDKDFPQSDDFIGSCSVELSTLEKEKTHKLTLELSGNTTDEYRGSISILVTISGSTVTESAGADMSQISKKYGLLRTARLKEKKDVGYLRVKVERAEDLPTADTCAAVQLCNAVRLTQTVYNTTSPVWEKTFEFKVLDIHEELIISIYKSRGTKLVGRVKIPLHRIRPGLHAYPLKTKDCLERAKGVVYLDCEMVYNPIRAAIRTINPMEESVMDDEEKFSRKVLMNNISRFTQLIRTILATWELIKSLWSWEDKTKSACSFIVFLLACLFGELWMFLLVGCFVFMYCYTVVYIRGKHLWQLQKHSSYSKRLSITSEDSAGDGFSDFSDIEEELDNNKSRKNLRAKFKQLQEVLLIIQKVLGYIDDTEERVRNLFNWSVPFLCWMAIGVFFGGAVLFYFVPLRYVILVWGINKWSKRLLNPNYISNTELLDFISRSPTNKQLEQWRQFSVHSTKTKASPNPKMKKQKSTIKDKKKK